MKKFILLSITLAILAMNGKMANARSYTADDKLIDQVMKSAPETVNLFMTAGLNTAFSATRVQAASKDAVVAILLDFFLGEFGVHRFYLGTEVLTGVGYILTCGGIFGIVPLVDFIVLIVNYNDISKYVNNPRFFMWAKQ